VHASTDPEPFGLVIVEGMACGRAVIASHAGGVPEIVTDGHDAIAHDAGDIDGLAACVLRLVSDAALRERLGQAGRATAIARFDRARLGPETAGIYRALLAGSR
jgi:glycosyltransferase involved in cell wall biosynthesis